MADEKPEVIRHHIEETSHDLKQKVEMLEEQVIGTVKGATDAVGGTVEKVKETVQETIDTVKETVQETVSTVKRTFDLPYQVRQHPWAMFGGSFVAGFVTGKVFGHLGGGPGHAADGRGYRSAAPAAAATGYASARSSFAESAPAAAAPAASRNAPGFLSRFLGQFDGEIQKVKQMAIGTVLGVLRDMAKRSLPETLAPKVDEVMNSVTTKLGGQTMPSPVVESSSGPARY